MDIVVKKLNKEDIHRITEIDRSELIKNKYVYKSGNLEAIEINHNVPTWTSKMNEENIRMLAPILEKGGHLLGAFDKEKLVGVAVLGGEFMGENQDELQMAFLYASNGYRRRGIGKKLMDNVSEIAKSLGALPKRSQQ